MSEARENHIDISLGNDLELCVHTYPDGHWYIRMTQHHAGGGLSDWPVMSGRGATVDYVSSAPASLPVSQEEK